jgi:Domain of unknown function (DUF4234)
MAITEPEPPPLAGAGTSPDVIHSVTKLDRAIKLRRDSDVQLVNWWLCVLLLSWLTLGIYPIYLYFKRLTRIDRFSERKQAYYEAVLEWTEREAEAKGQMDAIHHELDDLSSDVSRAYQTDLRPINAGLSFVLTLITIGFYGFFVLYRMNRYWWDAQVVEQDFDDKLSQTWTKLGILRYPLTFHVDQSKRRSYPLYLILSIVTLGIWSLVWDYKIHTDPDNLYGGYHAIEDSVLQLVRAH